MGKIYHKILGMIEDTAENKALFNSATPKIKENDTITAEPTEQDSVNTKRTSKSKPTK